MTDDAAMHLALELAAGAQGFSSPNPPVGAVIVRAGVVLGTGATQPLGGPHAEIVALRAAGELAQGATLFVTLEPHCFHGHTPPCTDAIIAAGISTVVVATLDPNPRVHGAGVAQLRAAGITVVVGPGAAQATTLIAPFAHWLATQQPLGIAKFAMSLDGKIATHTGESQWITGPAARTQGHTLRQASDAILVGSVTAVADDPRLTTRLPDHDPAHLRHPLRVVVDSRGTLPATARMLTAPGQTLIATTAASDPDWRRRLTECGAAIILLPASPLGHVDLVALWQVLGERGALTVLIEGGGTILGAAIAAGLVQRVHAFIAPRLIGSSAAPGPVGDPGFAALTDAPHLRWTRLERLGDDIWLEGDVAAE